MKVLLTFLNFGPYHSARLTAAQKGEAGAGVEVVGLSMASRQTEYDWQENSSESILCASPDLPLEQVPTNHWRSLLTPILNQIRPDVCAIAGYSHPSMLTLISLCGERGIPCILMSESQGKDEKRRSWQEWIKSRLVRLASSGLAGGSPHLDYLATLGLPAGSCSTGYDVVDNHYFAGESARWKTKETSPNPPYFLASNRFIPKKNLFRLLDAYALYAKPFSPNKEPSTKNEAPGHAPWPLVLLGDGELKSDLLAHARNLGLEVIESAPWEMDNLSQESHPPIDFASRRPSTLRSDCPPLAADRLPPTLFLPGFRQIDELPRFYAHAGAFVHASTTEQWGLVVNEAMASGLPVIVSNRCGCAPDLVEEGKNGFTFDPHQVDEIATLMERVANLPDTERKALGEAGGRLIADWGPERFAKGLEEAAERAMATKPKRGSWMDRLLLKLLIRR